MKKCIILLVTMIFLVGCNGETTSNANEHVAQDSTSLESNENVNSETASNDVESNSEEVEETVVEVVKIEDKTLTDVVDYLKGEGFLDGEHLKMAAEYIGGLEGIKYKSQNGNVEIYEMDVNTDEYKAFVEDGYIMMSGFKVTASAINNKFLLLCENNTDKETLVNLFQSIE